MDYQTIQFDISEKGIARLTLNRPQVSNAFNAEMIAEMTDAIARCSSDSATRLLLLDSQGSHFSVGADIHWMKSMARMSYDENQRDANALANLMHALYTLKKPSIAVVNGAAFGGAVGLIACADMAFADHKATFCLSEVRLGLVPAVISPYVIQAIGARNASRYFLTAEVFDASAARQAGLITESYPAADLDSAVNKIITQILGNGPSALHEAKVLIRRVANQAIDDDLRHYTADLIARIRVSPEGQEGLNAFLEKRKPVWSA